MKSTQYIIISGIASVLSLDPCQDSMQLHSIEGRSPQSNAQIPCDAYITQGWYKTPRYDMVTYDPGLVACGSIFPVYLQGNLTDDDNIQDMTACTVSNSGGCSSSFIVRVKKCGDDRAYYLSPTGACDSTYCFHATWNYTDEAPLWIPSSVNVHPDVEFGGSYLSNPKYFFSCNFTFDDAQLLYKIYWFVDSKKIKESEFVAVADFHDKSDLKEEDLIKKGYKLNIMISCGVVAAKSVKGEPGNYTQSTEYFAGIRVLTPVVRLISNGNGEVVLKPTVPIPCPDYAANCKIQVWMYQETDDYITTSCQQKTNIASTRMCGLDIEGKTKSDSVWFQKRQWDKNVTMNVKHRAETNYDKTRTYQLQLRTSEVKFNSLWNWTLLERVTVDIVVQNPEDFKQTYCYGEVDPHMRTFDGNFFELHMQGDFLLYRHIESGTNVQVTTTSCGYNIFCFCGVAINAGRDIFTIYVCPGRIKLDKFVNCQDGLLKASSKRKSEYQVFLPSGTIVEVKITGSQNYLNIYIYPSTLDLNKTQGLCGYFDLRASNDFIKRDGGYTTVVAKNSHGPTRYGTYINDFSTSWELQTIENLLPFGYNNLNNLLPWTNRIQYCYCEYNKEEGNTIDSVTPESVCDYREYADCKDSTGRRLTCNHHRDKRSILPFQENIIFSEQKQVIMEKRSVGTTYTEAEAYDRCSQAFQASEIVQICSVANLIDNSSLVHCVQDLMLTGNEAWIDEQIESSRMQCMHEVEFNTTFRQEQPDLTANINRLNCPNNCSRQGTCINGTCICNDGYYETDCSVGIADPPPIYSSSHSGSICDHSSDNCQEIDLYGEGFIYDIPPTLQVKKYKITSENEVHLIDRSNINCTWRGSFEVSCSLEIDRKKRDTSLTDAFVTRYTFAISNDGINFGSEMTLSVLNSNCQEMQNGTLGVIYTLKETYCFINGICYANNEEDPSSSCNICNSQKEKYKWSLSNAGACASTTSKPMVQKPPIKLPLIIGVSVAGSIVVIFIVFLVVYKCNKQTVSNEYRPHNVEVNSCKDLDMFTVNSKFFQFRFDRQSKPAPFSSRRHIGESLSSIKFD